MLLIRQNFLGTGGSAMTTDTFAGSFTLQTGPLALRSLGEVSVAPDLDDRFARELPELAVRWQAEAMLLSDGEAQMASVTSPTTRRTPRL